MKGWVKFLSIDGTAIDTFQEKLSETVMLARLRQRRFATSCAQLYR